MLLVAKRMYRTWPALTALCVVDLTSAAFLSHYARHSLPYFYAYYGGLLTGALVRLWLIDNVLTSFPGSSFARRDLRIVISVAGAVMASGSGYAATLLQKPMREFAATAIYLDRCVSYACGGVFLAAMLSLFASRLGWSWRGLLVVAGLGLRVCGGIVASTFYSSSTPWERSIGLALRPIVEISTLCIWIYAVSRPNERHLAFSRERLETFTSSIAKKAL